MDVIAPQSIEEDFDYIKINDVYFRTIFVGGYPRFVAPGWLEPVVNFDSSLDISFYIYPVDGKSVLDDLRRKIAEMEAEISTDIERGKIVDPVNQAKLEDAKIASGTTCQRHRKILRIFFLHNNSGKFS